MWQEINHQLIKEFKFTDFKSALDFVNKIGALAEKERHHPEIELGWGRVKVSLTTHEKNDVTTKDRELAKLIDKINS